MKCTIYEYTRTEGYYIRLVHVYPLSSNDIWYFIKWYYNLLFLYSVRSAQRLDTCMILNDVFVE